MAQITPITIGQQRESAATPLASPHDPVRSLYVHVPFCFHKCHYCDFYSFVDARDRQPAFTDRLLHELAALAPHAGPLETIFVGGGTPSLLRPDLWRRVLDALHAGFGLAHAHEFTVECNPETVTPELMATLHAGGVNRVSIGAQSFDPRHLKTLERWHDPANVERALRLAADAGIARRSIDLIFGIPGQTLDDWRRDLDTALALMDGHGIEHLSCYALTYEPNTAMTQRLRMGRIEAIDEDVETAMYEAAVETLRAAGFDRYEVSNFAKPGAECRHNLVYWRCGQWLAAGPSASAHVGGWRWKNVPRLTDWMQGVESSGGFAPATDLEPPDPRRALAERLMMNLRLAEGIDEPALLAEADRLGVRDRLERAVAEQRGSGMVSPSLGGTGVPPVLSRLRLTERGFLFADGVASTLMSAVGA